MGKLKKISLIVIYRQTVYNGSKRLEEAVREAKKAENVDNVLGYLVIGKAYLVEMKGMPLKHLME